MVFKHEELQTVPLQRSCQPIWMVESPARLRVKQTMALIHISTQVLSAKFCRLKLFVRESMHAEVQ